MSLLINILKLFIEPDDKLILFNSFAGRSFNDSPKAIYDYMLSDSRFKEYKLIWAFHNPEKYDGVASIRTDSMSYFRNVLAARVWVTNSSFERGLNFTGKNTLYFNTWHGTPMKKMGTDIVSENTSFGTKGDSHIDVLMSQGKYETDIFSRCFGIEKEKILEVGLPRNDILANYTDEQRNEIRRKFDIKDNQTVILYCPTFREYDKDKNYSVIMAPPINFDKWRSKLGDDYIIFLRAHYEVSNIMDIRDSQFVHDMTNYANINDLYIASDILISDYSSVFFDYSITGKPMLHFTYDYEEYSSQRGLYFDVRQLLNGSNNEDDLIKVVLSTNRIDDKSIAFRDRFVDCYGHASKAAVNYIANELGLVCN